MTKSVTLSDGHTHRLRCTVHLVYEYPLFIPLQDFDFDVTGDQLRCWRLPTAQAGSCGLSLVLLVLLSVWHSLSLYISVEECGQLAIGENIISLTRRQTRGRPMASVEGLPGCCSGRLSWDLEDDMTREEQGSAAAQ
jgi:hypothetical protein